MAKFKPGQLVEVEWDDAIGENDGWTSRECMDYDSHAQGVKCKAAGYFLRWHKKQMFLSQIFRDTDGACARVLSIPVGCITKVRKVR